jgi:hypothetical protein
MAELRYKTKEFFVDWLKRATRDGFDPTLYQQLINAAAKGGQAGLQDTLGYEKKEQERKTACHGRWTDLTLDCVSLTFSKGVIGYGYRFYLCVFWVVLFVLMGTLAFRFVPHADRKGLKFGIAYSFDTFLPLIGLRKKHEDIDISNGVRYYFYVHKLAGWIIGTFLVAALAGFTK